MEHDEHNDLKNDFIFELDIKNDTWEEKIYKSSSNGLNYNTYLFEKFRDPIAGINAILFAQRGQLTIPESVLEWISNALEEYLENGTSLESTLELAATRGRRSARDEAMHEMVIGRLLEEMAGLQDRLGVTIDESAVMVSERYAKQIEPIHEDNKTVAYKPETLSSYWHNKRQRIWSRYHVNFVGNIEMPAIVGVDCSDSELLLEYPRHTWPHNLAKQ